MNSELLFNLIFSIVLVLVAGAVSFLLIKWFMRIFKVNADKEHFLKLANQGNTASLYHLSASSSTPELTFSFLFNNLPLEPAMEDIQEPILDGTATDTSNAAGPGQTRSRSRFIDPTKAVKAGKGAVGKASALTSLLGIIGGILPGKVGARLKSSQQSILKMQTDSIKVIEAPQLATNKMEAFTKASGKIGVKPSSLVRKGEANGDQMQAPTDEHGSPSADGYSNRQAKVVKREIKGVYQTGELAPGEGVVLTLRIGTSEKRYPAGSFDYDLQSQQVPVNKKFSMPDPVRKTGKVTWKSIPGWHYFRSSVASGLLLLLMSAGLVYGLFTIWS